MIFLGSGERRARLHCALLPMHLIGKAYCAPPHAMFRYTLSIWQFANPARFMKVTNRLMAFLWPAAGLMLAAGLVWGVFFTPPDQVQGATVKIIFLHVPSAMIAINAWLMMLAASIIWLIRRHHISALAAKAAAPAGLCMTAIAIATGALWGQPTWGTWWAWEPRLTSFLILFVIYAGYLALWQSSADRNKIADLAAWLCMFGSVFALLSRYSVLFWSQGLHQGATLSLDKETHIHPIYYFPLLLCIAGFVTLFLAVLLEGTRTEIRRHQIEVLIEGKSRQ